MSVSDKRKRLEDTNSVIAEQINDVEKRLYRYEVDVAEIKRLHNYEENTQSLKALQEKRDDITRQIHCLSLQEIGTIIHESIYTIRKLRLSEIDFWSYLYSTFNIIYREDGATPVSSSFPYFCNNALKDVDDMKSVIYYPDTNNIKLKHSTYFRGEPDSVYEFLVPLRILLDIDFFENSVNQYITERKTEIEAFVATQEAEREKAEYELYLKLKEKFKDSPEG